MRERYAAPATAGYSLASAGSVHAYMQQAQPGQSASTVAASAPMDHTVRNLATRRAPVSAEVQERHAAAIAVREAVVWRAARRTARVRAGKPCDGDPRSRHVWQPDGTCGGPIHRGGGAYFDNDGNTSNDPLIKHHSRTCSRRSAEMAPRLRICVHTGCTADE